MAIVEPRSQDKLKEYLELYCEPLGQEEELGIDTKVLNAVIDALPKEAGFTYDELCEQAELVRDPNDTPLPLWFWTAWLVGSKASKALEENPELAKRVSKFATHMFGDYLNQEWQRQDLIYGTWAVAPFAFIKGTAGGHRLYRLKNEAVTPDDVLQFFGKERQLLKPELPQHSYSLTMRPVQTVDRAARGGSNWNISSNDAPTFLDSNNAHTVAYVADDLTLEALRERVMKLNPRTADVWRLCTAAILEAWPEGQLEPPRVWIDIRELCNALGFTKHHKGGHRPENVLVAARAIEDLANFQIIIPHGEKQYPADSKTGNRKAQIVQARGVHKVLAIMGEEQAKLLFDNDWITMRWQITAGDWIKSYPREQFAPLFRALVELPGTYTPDIWAKSIGTELIWQFRQNRGKTKTERVETIFKQAGVLEDVRRNPNKKRVQEHFEKAMDKLEGLNVYAGWEYKDQDDDRIDIGTKGWFEQWLQARIIITPTQEVAKAMERIAKSAMAHRRNAKPRPPRQV